MERKPDRGADCPAGRAGAWHQRWLPVVWVDAAPPGMALVPTRKACVTVSPERAAATAAGRGTGGASWKRGRALSTLLGNGARGLDGVRKEPG